MNKNVFILEIDGELKGVYENRQSAVLDGVLELLKEVGKISTEKEAVGYIKELVEEGCVEDWLYIYEKPFHGDPT